MELPMKIDHWLAQALKFHVRVPPRWRPELRCPANHVSADDYVPAKVRSLKELLSALIEGNYSIQRLTQLARSQIEAAWNDLSLAEFSELDAWLTDQQMTATARAQIAWIYIRATFTSIQQERGPITVSRPVSAH
jgi:hypothetical protein